MPHIVDSVLTFPTQVLLLDEAACLSMFHLMTNSIYPYLASNPLVTAEYSLSLATQSLDVKQQMHLLLQRWPLCKDTMAATRAASRSRGSRHDA